MTCRPLHVWNPKFLSSPMQTGPNANPKPIFGERKSNSKDTYYLCDPSKDFKRLFRPSKKSRGGPFGRTAAVGGIATPMGVGNLSPFLSNIPAPLAAPKTLPPRPKTPIARLIYDITTQLDDFELRANLKAPVQDKVQGQKVTARTHIVLGDHGRLDVARLTLHPPYGPMAIPVPVLREIAENVPIIGIVFYIRVLEIQMDPQDRKLKAKVKLFVWPWNDIDFDLQKALVKKIPSDLHRGPGYDLKKGLPKYTWQIAELGEEYLRRKKDEGLKQLGKVTNLDKIVPLFDQGRVWITGDFSNQEIKVRDVTLKFFPKKKGEQHRILISGPLFKPVMKVWGLKSLHIGNPEKGEIHMENTDPTAEPLQIRVEVDKANPLRSIFRIPHHETKGFKIWGKTRGDKPRRMQLDLKRGFELNGLSFRMEKDGPHVHVDEVTGKQMDFAGLGVNFHAGEKDKATLKNIRFSMVGGKPHFHAEVVGRASGEIAYEKGDQEIAWMKIEELRGKGTVDLGIDEKEREYFRLAGNLATRINELRLLVRSEKIKALVHTEIKKAKITGRGSLTIWPRDFQVRLQGREAKNPIRVKGEGGRVWFHQDSSQLATWPELKARLGADLAKRVHSDFFIDVKKIDFEVGNMELRRIFQAKSQTPALEILDAKMSDIRINGDLYGKLVVKMPGGVPFPLEIDPKKAKMKDATVRIGGLRDWLEGDQRNITFTKIFIDGEESAPTLTNFDKKRCGFDRQRIHAELGLFQFSPDSKTIQVKNLGKDFRLQLKMPRFLGGCIDG